MSIPRLTSHLVIPADSAMWLRLAVCLGLLCASLPAPGSAQETDRPPGWSDASHSEDAAPDYGRIFAMDRVHELHITIEPDDFAAMQADLQSIGPGALGGRGGFGIVGGGPGRVPAGPAAFGGGTGADPGPGAGPDSPPGAVFRLGPRGDFSQGLTEQLAAASSVCAAQASGAACSIDGMEGQCQAVMGADLVCIPEAMAGFVGGIGAGGGAPDLIAEDPMYVPVTVTYDGRTWPGVGMRYKGNSSLMTAIMSGNGKVPFRLDFDRYEDEIPGTSNQRFYGFDKLTFSSNFSDDGMLKEVLATEVFRDFGVPAARAAFYRVMVDIGNGPEYWGLYTMIEDPADGAMLDSQFAGDEGNLYKPDGPGANWAFFDPEGFDKKTNEKAADFSDVAAAIAALHASRDDPAAWRAGLEAAFDVELFLRWLAVNTVIENWDSYGRLAHNYYLYGDPGDAGRLKWIPWDHNMSFGMAGGGVPAMGRGGFPGQGRGGAAFGGAPFPLPDGVEDIVRNGAMAFMGGGGDDILHQGAGSAWPLMTNILADQVYGARYRDLLQQALGGLFAPAVFESRVRELHALVAPYVVGEQGERPSHTTLSAPGGFESALGGLLEWASVRRDQVRQALAGSL